MQIPTLALTGLFVSLAFAGCIGASPNPAATKDEGVAPSDLAVMMPRNLTHEGKLGAFACAYTPAGGRCAVAAQPNNGLISQSDNDTAGHVAVTATWKASAPYTEELNVGIFKLKSACGEKCTDKDLDEVKIVKGKSPLTLEGEVGGLYGVFAWKNECVQVVCVRPIDQAFRLEATISPMHNATMEHGHPHV